MVADGKVAERFMKRLIVITGRCLEEGPKNGEGDGFQEAEGSSGGGGGDGGLWRDSRRVMREWR